MAFSSKPPPWAVQLTAQITQIQKGITKIMAQVQADQSVFDNAAAAIESLVAADEALVKAVKDFLANPQVQQLPAAVVTVLDQAVSDAGTAKADATAAQTALQNATTPPAPTP